MNRNIIETVLGACVLLVAVGFLFFAFESTGLSSSGGYDVARMLPIPASWTSGFGSFLNSGARP